MATDTRTSPVVDLRVDLQANCSAVVREEVAVRAVHDHYTYEDVATEIGMEYTAFTKAMKGQRKWKPEEMVRLAHLFGLSFEELTAAPKGLTRNRCFSASAQVGESEIEAHESHHAGRPQTSTEDGEGFRRSA